MNKELASIDLIDYNKQITAVETEAGKVYKWDNVLLVRLVGVRAAEQYFIKAVSLETLWLGNGATCYAQDDPKPPLPEGTKRVKDLAHGDCFVFNTSAVGLKNGYVHFCLVLGHDRHYREMCGKTHLLSELDPDTLVYIVVPRYALQGEAK